MSDFNTLVDKERRFGASNYAPLPVVLTRGQGCHVWDSDGNRYLDMMSAYSAASLGHAHPRILATLQQQAAQLAVVSRAFYTDRLAPWLEQLCALCGMDMALPMNTGAEAVETGLKAARKWAYEVKGVPADRAEIIACRGNFHGRTIATVAMSSEAGYRQHFGPFPPGFRLIDFDDPDALEAAITPHTAAFFVEPVQGEGGIIVPRDGYLAACTEICKAHNVLLICDEVQTGLGRTGTFLAAAHDGISPDGLMLGKALGGGLYPVSAFLARREILGRFAPGDHGSTFGGNPLAAAIASTTLDVLQEQNLVANSANMGARLAAGLERLASPLIREVRGRGLLLGIDIDPRYATARAVCERLMAHGILTKDTHETVVRLAPPLIIDRALIDDAVERVGDALKSWPEKH